MKLTTMFAVMAMAIAAFAQEAAPQRAMPNRPLRPNMPGRFMDAARDPALMYAMSPMAAKTLGITEEQQAKIKEINTAMREKVKVFNEQQRAAMDKQNQLIRAEKPDEAAIMKAIDESFEIQKARAKEQVKATLATRAVLTPEQLAKAAEEVKNMRSRARRPTPPKAEAKPAEAKPAEVKPAEPAKK